jgi:hypothetical protein
MPNSLLPQFLRLSRHSDKRNCCAISSRTPRTAGLILIKVYIGGPCRNLLKGISVSVRSYISDMSLLLHISVCSVQRSYVPSALHHFLWPHAHELHCVDRVALCVMAQPDTATAPNAD